MPSRYISKREQVNNFFNDVVVKLVSERDLDKAKLIIWIASKTLASPKLIEETLNNFVVLGKLKIEKDCITIPDEAVVDFLKNTKALSKEEIDKILV
jgi:hypothetical protein